MILLGLQALYGLSWGILFGAVIYMVTRPAPSDATLTAILATIMGAFYYIAVYYVGRGVVRACRRTGPQLPTQDPIIIRRLILEEVTPRGAGQPEHRVVLEEVTLNERSAHAR